MPIDEIISSAIQAYLHDAQTEGMPSAEADKIFKMVSDAACRGYFTEALKDFSRTRLQATNLMGEKS